MSFLCMMIPGTCEAASAQFAVFTNVCCALNAIWIAMRKAHPHLHPSNSGIETCGDAQRPPVTKGPHKCDAA